MIGILVDNGGDVAISTATDSDGKLMGLALGDVRADIIERVMYAVPGEIKHIPQVGVNISSLLGGNKPVFFPAKTIDQLRAVGVPVTRVRVENNDIVVNYAD